jgi:DNA-binding transcriptional MerR regulator
VRLCQSLGFTLDTIRGFFSGDGGCDHGHVLEQIAIRTRTIKAEQAALQAQLAQLEKLQGFLENGAIPDSACTLPYSR